MTAATSPTSVQTALRHAAWISPVETGCTEAGNRPAYWLRGTFDWTAANQNPDTPNAADERAVLHATAHGIYELFVNGNARWRGRTDTGLHVLPQAPPGAAVGHHGPAGPRRKRRCRTALATGGSGAGTASSAGPDGFGTETAFLASVTNAPGTETFLGTGERWLCRESHITRADLMDGQTTDFRRHEPAGLSPSGPAGTAGTTAEGWVPVVRPRACCTKTAPGWSCRPRRRRGASRSCGPSLWQPRRRASPSSTSGRTSTAGSGWAASGRDGTRTVLRHGEVLDTAGLVSTANIRAFNFATRSPCPPDRSTRSSRPAGPDDVFEPRHTTHGFRYVQVEGQPGTLAAEDITAVVVHTHLRPHGLVRMQRSAAERPA